MQERLETMEAETADSASNGSPLARRRLGKSELSCTSIGLGCAPLGELFVRVDDVTAEATLEAAWANGIRYFDTAPEYGFGLSEHRLGRFLRNKPRNEVLLSTKVGRLLQAPRDLSKYKKTFWTGGLDFDFRFDYGYDAIMRSVEDSYQRLGLSRVDVLLIHDLDVFTHGSQAQVDAYLTQLLTGGWRALAQLKADGMVGAIGAGLNDAGMMLTLLQATDPDFFLLAMRYTLMEQDTLDREMQECSDRGVGVVVGGVFNSGITASGAIPGAYYNYAPATEPVLKRVREMEAVCARHNVPLPAAALQFPLGHKAVAAVIPGAVNPAQVADNLGNMRHPIAPDFWAELKAEGLIRKDAPTPS
jgi:D-threo-aldose 1-dehydrogenase